MCIKYTIVASRGRNPDNPSERAKSNGTYRQRLEPNVGGVTNTITGVQKDNYVLEIYECRKETEADSQGVWLQEASAL